MLFLVAQRDIIKILELNSIRILETIDKSKEKCWQVSHAYKI